MIRKATLDDIPAIRQIACKAFPATYMDILSGEQIGYMMEMMYSEQSLRQQMTVEDNIFHLIDGQGYVSFRYAGKNGNGTSLFHLEKLYVLPDFQGRGIGRMLVDSVIDAVRESVTGQARIELNVNRHNKAVSFYEHIGMRRDRQGDFPIGNGFFMNDYIMVLDL